MLIRYFNERLVTSPRQRMAVAGREILRWLAQPHVLQTQRAQFEALLLEIAEYAEEWLTSAQAMGLAERRTTGRVMPWDRGAPTPTRSGLQPLMGGDLPNASTSMNTNSNQRRGNDVCRTVLSLARSIWRG